MAEENSNPVFQIQRMYLKDLSLEIPHAPHIFLEQAQPTVEVAIDNGHEKLADGIYEVTITVTVTTRIDEERVVFLVEGKQAGIFEIRNIPEDQMDVVLNIVCPNTVYPYLRANIADVIQRSGFPPIHLAEINFEVLCQQRLAAAQQQGGKLAGAIIKLTQKAGVDGRLFGSVTNANVAETLHKAGFASVQKSMIRMPEGHIKTIGEHPVQVALHTDVLVDITINVVGETA